MNHEGQNHSTVKVDGLLFLKKKTKNLPSISKHFSTSMLLFKKEKKKQTVEILVFKNLFLVCCRFKQH